MKYLKQKRNILLALFFCFTFQINSLELDYSYNGSVTQTFVQTTGNQEDWNAEFPNTDEGSLKFTELILGGGVDFTENFRVGAQGISRVYGTYGNYDLTLDWGFADYRINEYFGLRAGKVKYAAGLYNESRDVDAARTSILLSQSVYPESLRSFVTAATGGSIYGSLDTEKYGILDYQFTYGISDIPDDFSLNALLNNAAVNSNPDEFEGDGLFGAHLMYNAPWDSALDGSRLGFTWSEFKGTIDITDPLAAFGGPGNFEYELDVSTVVGSIEYSNLKYTFGAEYSQQQLTSEIPDNLLSTYATLSGNPNPAIAGLAGAASAVWNNVTLPILSTDTRSYYLFGAYQFHEKHSTQLMWSRSDPKNSRETRDRYTLSHRFDFNENIITKLEYSQVYDVAGKWGVFLARIGYSF